MRLRVHLYRRGFWKIQETGVPVVSVGNLTMGGTGKTPFVRFIAELLLENGFKPAIISRGYGGKSNSDINIVSDGKTVLMDSVQAGDEPVLLAQSLQNVPVLTGKVRALPCRYAVTHFDCNILILDDGFQHLAVARDFDLVLFNAASPLGNKRIFPGGDLREPLSALSRAQAFVLTGMHKDYLPQAKKFHHFLDRTFCDTPVFFSTYRPSRFVNIADNSSTSFHDIPSPAYGFCGIANPRRFHKTLKDCGFKLKGFMELKDHQAYQTNIIDKIESEAKKNGAQVLITTEKDSVKLRSFSFSLPVYAVTMAVETEKTFTDFFLEKIHKRNN